MPAKRSPASLHLLNARLQALKNPSFLGWIVVIVLPLLLLADAWKHPEQLTSANQDVRNNRLIVPSQVGTTSTPLGTPLPSTILMPDFAALSTKTISPHASQIQTNLSKELLLNAATSAEQEQSGESKAVRKVKENNRRNRLSLRHTLPSSSLSDPFGALPSTSTMAQPDSASTTMEPSALSVPSPTDAATSSSQLETAFDRIMGQSIDASPTNPTPYSQPKATVQTPANSYAQPADSPLNSPSNSSRSFSPSSGFQPYSPQPSSSSTTGYRVPPAFRTTTNTPGFFSNNGLTDRGTSRSSTGLRSDSQPTSTLPSQSLPQSGYGTTANYNNPATAPVMNP